MIITTVVQDGRDRQRVNTWNATFFDEDEVQITDPAVVECTLDAVWTALKEGRGGIAEHLLAELGLSATQQAWWLPVLFSSVRPPIVR